MARPTFLKHEIVRPSYIPATAWLRHGPFAMWLMKAARPRRVVELGSHYGYSYFAFCEAIRQSGIRARCVAVDTWAGDEHSGFYGEEVFEQVHAENKKYQGFSTLLRKTFAEALEDVPDGSVDILHVDGRHFYEDVKEDVESWTAKLSETSIVLLHDTEVRERGFGVWRYWEELSAAHPTFNFTFQHGLGVWFRGGDMTPELAAFRKLTEDRAGHDAVMALFRAEGEALAADHTQRFLAERSAEGAGVLAEHLKALESGALPPESQVRLSGPGASAMAASFLSAATSLDAALAASATLSAQMIEMSAARQRVDQQALDVQKDLDEVERLHLEVQAECVRWSEQVAEVAESLRRAEQRTLELQNGLDESEGARLLAQAECARLSENLADASEARQRAEKQAAELRNELDDLRIHQARLNARVEQSQPTIDALSAENEALRSENQRLTQEHLQLGAQAALLQSTILDVQRENTALRTDLARVRLNALAAWKETLAHRLLNRLALGSLPIRERARARFARSARKRDPNRSLIEGRWPALQIMAAAAGPNRAEAGELSPGPQIEAFAIDAYSAVRRAWLEQRAAQADQWARLADDLRQGPLISVVVPVYNTDAALLREMIESVLAQTYSNWELCIADDCSTDLRVREVLEDYAGRNKKVRVVFRERNGHISLATNSAIEIARGTHLALLDHDDVLHPDALLCVASALRDAPGARIVYTDEDKVREDGSFYEPHFKPDWNRELLYGINYISHLGVYDAGLVREVGGLREGFEGAQDYDLLLRCLEHVEDAQIVHIPKVLYSWRAVPGSTAASNEAKPYATDAGRRALAEHLERVHGRAIPVEAGPVPFTYRVLWPIEDEPLVSIVIPTRDQVNLLRVAVQGILEKTDYRNLEVLIVDNGSRESETLAWFAQVQARDARVRVLRDERPFNYSALNNAAVGQAKGDLVALVNNDVEVIEGGWLREMVSLAVRPDVGCVGAKLHYPDGRVQHGGVVIGIGGVAGHVHHFYPEEDGGYFARLLLRQEFTAVTAACLVVRRSVFEEVGGLNETDLHVAFNDIDFCLKVRDAGYRNVWTPWARLYHHESASRGYEDTPEKKARFGREVGYMKATWSTDRFRDPAYNPNLTLDRSDFGFGAPQWTA